MKRAAGFTLVEIAIVLVIIGLLLGGVLKGQEMIDNSKIRNLRNDFDGIAAAVYAYQDRYQCVPGDDSRAGRWSGATAGNCNGNLESSSDAFDVAAGERRYFWQDLRYAGLIKGDPAALTAPVHAFGGAYGVVSGDGTLPLGLAGQVVLCADMVPLKAAEAIDAQMDDGLPGQGGVRAMATAAANSDPAGATAAAYSDANAFYVVCKAL